MSFWTELKRRNVVKVGMAYIVVGWIMLEVASVMSPALNLPEWATSLVAFLLILGFPVALLLAWAYELTPDGIKRAADVPIAESIASATGRKLNYSVTALLAVAVVFLIVERFVDSADQAEMPSQASAPAVGDDAVVQDSEQDQQQGGGLLENSVAVLPFANLSPDSDNAYFAAGIHESTLNQLAKIRDLNVIARTSVLQYQDEPPPIPEIAEALNVEMVMEGSVRYANDRVLITAQLIDGRSGTHLWSEEYDRDLADVFAVQSEIAQRIAMALEAELTEAERDSIEQPPTTSREAYAFYLRAMAIWDDSETAIGSQTIRESVQAYLDEAIIADPQFALAYAERAYLTMMTLNLDPGTAGSFAIRTDLEQRAIADLERALSIDPGLGAAHGMMARIHQYNWRADEAQAAYERALELSANDPQILSDFAIFSVVQGRREEALVLAQRAVELDPNSGTSYQWAALAQGVAGDLRSAYATLSRGLAVSPAHAGFRQALSWYHIRVGNNSLALEQLRAAERSFEDNSNPVYHAELAYYYGRIGQADDAMRIFRWLEERSGSLRTPQAAWVLAYLAIGDEAQALEWMRRAAEDPQVYEGHFATMFLASNAYGDPLLDQPEFVEARSRIAFGSRQGGG